MEPEQSYIAASTAPVDGMKTVPLSVLLWGDAPQRGSPQWKFAKVIAIIERMEVSGIRRLERLRDEMYEALMRAYNFRFRRAEREFAGLIREIYARPKIKALADALCTAQKEYAATFSALCALEARLKPWPYAETDAQRNARFGRHPDWAVVVEKNTAAWHAREAAEAEFDAEFGPLARHARQWRDNKMKEAERLRSTAVQSMADLIRHEESTAWEWGGHMTDRAERKFSRWYPDMHFERCRGPGRPRAW